MTADPVSFVIFGGAGDLARRKLLPALYNLHVDRLLPERWLVCATGRGELSDDAYRALVREAIERYSRRPIDAAAWDTFARGLFFEAVDLEGDDDTSFASLGARLDLIEHERGVPGNRIYYLAVPPAMFVPAVRRLARARFIPPPGDRRIARLVVEKPIGHDLGSARTINDALVAAFDEPRVFRIDHYLGKETVQNLLVLRFANSIFEPLFNHKYVDHVQITVAETEGVGSRAGYYDRAGALRDMVQNHLLQLLSLVAMEPPHSLAPDVIRDEKLEVLQSLRPITGEAVDQQTVRGRYAAGRSPEGPLAGYLDETGVAPHSRTETYAALELLVDNWRWSGVPFYLRTGKRMPQRASEISIHLKPVPPILFNAPANALIGPCLDVSSAPLEPNVLVIRLQPDEGFSFSISSKIPGPQMRVTPVDMDFQYHAHFGTSSPEAYERLLLDVVHGDSTLFMRRDSVETAWRFVAPILDRWAECGDALPAYDAGTWGPVEADYLLARAGRRWRAPDASRPRQNR
ncbi:MAG: glucose-6-phosphate dehydrogenase [Vicinamibacterales bacterium]